MKGALLLGLFALLSCALACRLPDEYDSFSVRGLSLMAFQWRRIEAGLRCHFNTDVVLVYNVVVCPPFEVMIPRRDIGTRVIISESSVMSGIGTLSGPATKDWYDDLRAALAEHDRQKSCQELYDDPAVFARYKECKSRPEMCRDYEWIDLRTYYRLLTYESDVLKITP